jgi:hypothetical protein
MRCSERNLLGQLMPWYQLLLQGLNTLACRDAGPKGYNEIEIEPLN